MPDNDFLKGIQTSQFIKESNDQIKKNLSSVMSNTTKAFSASTAIQTQSLSALKNIDKSMSDMTKQLEVQAKMMSKNNNEILAMQKSTKSFLVDASKVKTSQTTQQARSFFKREDPQAEQRQNIADIEELLIDIRDNDEKARNERKSSILGNIGKMLAVGGLAGYLMTGKKEMLFSVAKGMRMALKPLTKGLGLLSKGIGGLLGTGLGKMIKPFTKGLSKVLGKSVGKTAGKVLGRGMGKAFLKKIPVVGGLMGLMFGIQRFKKGDWVGGLLEVASGISSIVPGVGTALGVAIDGLLLFRDFKGVETGQGSVNDKLASGSKKIGKQMLRNIPGIGTFMRIKEGIDQWKSGDKGKAIKSFGGAWASLIPGGGVIADIAGSLIDNGVKGTIGKMGGFFDMGGDKIDKGGDIVTRTVGGKKAFGKMSFKKGKDRKPMGADAGFIPRKIGFFDRTMRMLKNYPGISLFKPWQPDLFGLQPDMLDTFGAMADEYYGMTGENIQVNSAKRSGGGRSVHDYGWALDIQSADANKLSDMGLLEKYGFHRPLLNWGKLGGKDEPWHIEPYPGDDVYGSRDTINNDFRIGTLMNRKPKSVKPQQGGGGFNFPQGTVDDRVKTNKAMDVKLTSSDIQNLAEAFGDQIRRNKDIARNTSSTMPTAMSRSSF